jgi:carboxyl-terminal processing protease
VTEADLSGRLDNANDGDGEDNDSAARRGKRVPNELLSRDNQLYEALTLLKGIHILGMYKTGDEAAL